MDTTTLAIIRQDAQKAWDNADKNQRAGIRFGMFDKNLLKAAGYDSQKPAEEEKQFVLALMDCAKRDGGMRA